MRLRTLVIGLGLVLCAASVSAQGTVNITGTDPSTGGRTQVGSVSANALRVAIVNASGTTLGVTNPLPVRLTDGTSFLTQDTQLTHDGALTVGSTTGGAFFGRASAAVPTDVSADNDAVLPWMLRSGAAATQPTYAGVLAVAGNGASGTGVQRVTLANDSTGVVTSIPSAAASAGVAECVVLSAASTNSTSCKAAAANLYGYEFYNTSTTVYYLRFYNASSAPTCSSATNFIRSIPIPPAAAAGQVGGAVADYGNAAVAYSTGIGYCITGGSSSTDNTNAATGIFGTIRAK